MISILENWTLGKYGLVIDFSKRTKVMAPSGDKRNMPSEQSSPNSLEARRHRHIRKRKRVKFSESETNTPILTLERSQTEEIRRGRWLGLHCQRKWTYSAHDVSKLSDSVIVVSYNILGVDNARKHPQLYSRVSPEYLDWEYRKKLLCREIRGYQASILCFQEVDHFDDLKKILQKDGFRGLYKARGGEACDGCAIFWKTKQFTLLHEENMEFQKFGLRNNVAQFCVLKVNEDLSSADATSQSTSATTSRSLVVGNIHVLYNPKRGDIKLGQMRMFLERAYELSQEWGCIPVIIMGDLNSLPQSAMYQFLASSKLHLQQHDRRQISGQICPSEYRESQFLHNHRARWTDEEIMLATGSIGTSLRHPLKLRSAYSQVPGSANFRGRTGEPLATSHHSLFTGTVDYIWYTSELVPVKVLEGVPMHSLKKMGGLPSKEWGSDHLAIACELAFGDEKD